MEQTWLFGLMTGLGLIVVIGAQNIFVLTNGIGGRNLVLVPAVCFGCDAVLLTLGICGFGTLVSQVKILLVGASVLGFGFLGYYGFQALRAAFSNQSMEPGTLEIRSRRAVLGATLAITLLNPHVYLDTVVVMGSVGSRFGEADRFAFLAGAVTASLVWFFGLSLAGRTLAPVLRRPQVWRVLHLGVWAMLWFQAGCLGWYVWQNLGSGS